MNQRTERRHKNERRTLPTPGDRRSHSEPVKVLDWSEPKALDWSDADEKAPDESGRLPESGNE